MALTHRHELFLAAYLEGDGTKGNATASAAAAGFKQPKQQGSRLLTFVAIAERIAAHEQAIQAAVEAKGIAGRQRRVDILNDMAHRLLTVFSERGADPSMASVAGGSTGLMVRQVKGIGRGEDFQVVEEYKVDDGAMGELRATLRQVAEDTGQLVTKIAPTDPSGDNAYDAYSDDALRTEVRALLARGDGNADTA